MLVHGDFQIVGPRVSELKQMSRFLPLPYMQSASALHSQCPVGARERGRQAYYIVIIGVNRVRTYYFHTGTVSWCNDFSLGCLGMKQWLINNHLILWRNENGMGLRERACTWKKGYLPLCSSLDDITFLWSRTSPNSPPSFTLGANGEDVIS